MLVYIVLRNGNVDAVFDNEKAAIHHRDMLVLRWAITSIHEYYVNEI